jgi:hypothetical protein
MGSRGPMISSSASSQSIIAGAGVMVSGLLAALGPGMTVQPSIFEKSATARVASRI